MSVFEFIKGLLGLSWVVLVVVGICMFASHAYNAMVNFSPLTEQGMKWQRENNPEYIKADALKRIADEMQKQSQQNKAAD